MSVTAFALALIVSTPQAGAPVTATVSRMAEATELAVQPLAAGQADRALVMLEKASTADPQDAAVLINLGIAYAQTGNDAKARTAFEAALACDDVIELDTADGNTTDSRRLARKAIKMLERGEFRAPATRSGQLTLRD